MVRIVSVAALALIVSAKIALAIEPSDRCQLSKLKSAGKYAFCLLKAEARAIRNAAPPAYARCDSKFAEEWARAEASGHGSCPTAGDLGSLQAVIADHADTLAAALAGAPLVDCPGDLTACTDALAASDAEPRGQPLKSGQNACYSAQGALVSCAGTGQDGDFQKGVAPQYVDNGDGTITDHATGLMWEKLSDDDSVHDRDTTYSWPDAFGKVETLNLATFGGYGDWRLPNAKELQSIINFARVNPMVAPVFIVPDCVPNCTVLTCSCTKADHYWSSTTFLNFNGGGFENAWTVDFLQGQLGARNKELGLRYVRAVRNAL
jgi:hypothetical protein